MKNINQASRFQATKKLLIIATQISLYCFLNSNSYAETTLPTDFVYVDQIDNSIIQNLRYASSDNFMGTALDGYNTNRAILTKEAALALKKANDKFKSDGYVAVIYDAYRPQRAV